MIVRGNRVPGVIKDGTIYLNYELTTKKSDKLVIVFSAVDNVSTRNITSYYGYQNFLGANVLHIVDNFGAHGSYLLMINSDFSIQRVVNRLINKVITNLEISKENVYFVGSSKGATCSIVYGLFHGSGNVVCAEPQIMLGDFIFDKNYDNSIVNQSISYTMTGSLSKDGKDILNNLVLDFIEKKYSSFSGAGKIIYGNRTGYFEKHVKFLRNFDISGFVYKEEDFSNHNECIGFFKDEMLVINEREFR